MEKKKNSSFKQVSILKMFLDKLVIVIHLLFYCLLIFRSMEILMWQHQTPAALLPSWCVRHTLFSTSIVALLIWCFYQMKHAVGGLTGALWWKVTYQLHTSLNIYRNVLIYKTKLFLHPALYRVLMSVWMITWKWGLVCCHRAEKGYLHLLIYCPSSYGLLGAVISLTLILLVTFEKQNTYSFVLRKWDYYITLPFCRACLCILLFFSLNVSIGWTMYRSFAWQTLSVCARLYVHGCFNE